MTAPLPVVQHSAVDANGNAIFPTDWALDASSNAMQVVVDSKQLASGNPPVTGTLTSSTDSAQFTPIPGRGFNVSVWGTFSASLQLQASYDGTTWFNVGAAITTPSRTTVQELEAGMLYQLVCTLVSGTVNYRLSQ